MNIGIERNTVMPIAIQAYFAQTQPSPTEAPHAQEIPRQTFLTAAMANPQVVIHFDDIHESLYLRYDLPRIPVL
jgi:hypothetical protein